MIDDEDRENEGDLVYASTFSTPQKVNFMATNAKGLICVALSSKIADRLKLTPMVSNNNSQHETAFTVSVDAKECTTGISAYERDLTIKLLANYSTTPDDLVRPGHIFPLIAKEGGTLVRTGHTEGSVDICRLAGVAESAVICEIMKEDGTMARRDDLEKFAKVHNLSIVYISDIVEYRMKNESLIKVDTESKCSFLGNPVKRIDFIDHLNHKHSAFLFGNIDKTANVKFHNIAPDIELFSFENRYDSMINAINFLKKNGGVLIFLNNENTQNHYMKEYGIGAQIVNRLGIENIKLLVSVKGKEFIGISGFGLNVIEEIVPGE